MFGMLDNDHWDDDKLYEFIKAELGYPCIDLELELEKTNEFNHLAVAVRNTLDFLLRWSNEAAFEDYMILYTKTGVIEYDVPDSVYSVIEGGRTFAGNLTPWSSIGIGPGESIVSLQGMVNFDLGTFVAARTLLSDAEKLIGINYRLLYHRSAHKLRIIPTPLMDAPIMVRVYRVETMSEIYSQYNFRRLLLANIREILGNILVKDDFVMPGGGRINGDKILAKAEADKKIAMDAIMAEAPRPYFMTDLDL